jgi:hypothetical protein
MHANHKSRERVENRANKLDDYCQLVRTQLTGFMITLEPPDSVEPPHVTQFRRHVIDSFYTPQLLRDDDAVVRCAIPDVEPEVIYKLKARCRPPGSCIRDPAGPRCQVDPACVRSVVVEMLAMLPRPR